MSEGKEKEKPLEWRASCVHKETKERNSSKEDSTKVR